MNTAFNGEELRTETAGRNAGQVAAAIVREHLRQPLAICVLAYIGSAIVLAQA